MPAKKHSELDPLLTALAAITQLAKSAKVPAVIVGGVAAALLGRPRITKDVDLLVWLDEQRWTSFLQTAHKHGFVARIANPLEFATHSRVLLLRHEKSGVEVDVTFGGLPFEDAVIRRSSRLRVRGLSLPIPTPEDLVIMKIVAHRPRDLGDIEGVLDAHPSIDLAFIRKTLADFTELVPEIDLIHEFESLVARRRAL